MCGSTHDANDCHRHPFLVQNIAHSKAAEEMLGKSRNKLLFYCAAFDVKERKIVLADTVILTMHNDIMPDAKQE